MSMADVHQPDDDDPDDTDPDDDSVLDVMRDSGVGVVDPNITDPETPEIAEEDPESDR